MLRRTLLFAFTCLFLLGACLFSQEDTPLRRGVFLFGTAAAADAPTASWTGVTDRGNPMSFEVTSAGTREGAQWQNFNLSICFKVTTDPFGGVRCDIPYTAEVAGPGAIISDTFASVGDTFSFTGRFDSPGRATGTFEFDAQPVGIGPGGFSASGVWTATQVIAAPQVSIAAATVDERTGGTVDALFAVSLSQVAAKAITVDYATDDGTAAAGSDYLPVTGTLSIQPGLTSRQIAVPVVGDPLDEPDEYFTVVLTNAVNADIAVGSAAGTIVDDDLPSPPPEIASVAPSTGAAGAAVTLHGRYLTGTTAVAFGSQASDFIVLDDATIVTAVPQGASSAHIFLWTPSGVAISPAEFVVTYSASRLMLPSILHGVLQ